MADLEPPVVKTNSINAKSTHLVYGRQGHLIHFTMVILGGGGMGLDNLKRLMTKTKTAKINTIL